MKVRDWSAGMKSTTRRVVPRQDLQTASHIEHSFTGQDS